MIPEERPVVADSLYTATANTPPDTPPLTGTQETDVAIVGGGFTGLSTALHLAERGVKATVLEAQSPGWGASGRNGGQVNPGLKEDPETVLARFGPQMGDRMLRLSSGAPDLVFDIIRRHGISCDAVQPGWVQPAHDAASMKVITERVRQWNARGVPLRLLDRAQTQAMIGSEAYVGALFDPRGGNLHPLNYALGLAEAAQRLGATVHGQSRVTGLSRDGATHVLRTASGVLRARRVVVATNAYTDGLAPPLGRTLVPVRSVQVATQPLSDNLRRSILPARQAVADTRRVMVYYRMDADGRLLMGGRGAFDDRGTERLLQVLRDVSTDLFPQLGTPDWGHAWGGFLALTTDHFTHLTPLGEGILSATAYNGRGVALATAMGGVLADWATDRPVSALDFPVTDMRPIPFHFLRKPAVQATIQWYRLRDALGF
ncbi:FAD-binding oxidoreductase [Paroceanicella profunda]|uniref:FAD-binding oxidoreductase n=1 Tax=Paroceanicella profunda TaxID=2579971 RepID=A0A5B8FPT2_9RHOB|nr:FAD-dependent oxidoreductase [Paroceanicella profunda]QDL90536.1 FAD-binding oxidoreductase [Paroceanicella profunda]